MESNSSINKNTLLDTQKYRNHGLFREMSDDHLISIFSNDFPIIDMESSLFTKTLESFLSFYNNSAMEEIYAENKEEIKKFVGPQGNPFIQFVCENYQIIASIIGLGLTNLPGMKQWIERRFNSKGQQNRSDFYTTIYAENASDLLKDTTDEDREFYKEIAPYFNKELYDKIKMEQEKNEEDNPNSKNSNKDEDGE